MLILQHRGGMLDGVFFIVNEAQIGHIDPDPPGVLLHMVAYPPNESPIAVVEDIQEMRNRFALRRPVNE